MKIMTILGTRPEIIRLSLIIKKLDQFIDEHLIVHTGQNFTNELSDIFFKELGLRQPDYILASKQQSLGKQLAKMYSELEGILQDEAPDKILVLGDTNSGLSAILAERMGIPVYHMEAGNRCYDLEVPEEKNRRVIDAISTVNLPYTPGSKENLLREGIAPQRIYTSGNPINEVIQHYSPQINQSNILTSLSLQKGNYLLLTAHRAENVDHQERLLEILNGVNQVADHFNKRVICSIHPRTKSKIDHLTDFVLHPLVEFHQPFGFFDFVQLEKNAFCVLTDSGTVQEECCLFYIPTVTIRHTTERPETLACGSNMISGIDAKRILFCAKIMTSQPTSWKLPEGYEAEDVSDKVIKLLLGGLTVV